MAADTLRKVGWALTVVGLLDIGFMVYCIINEISYTSSLNVFAVIAGIFLLRLSMKAASIVSFVAAFILAAAAGAIVLFPLVMPFDLLTTHVRLSPVASTATITAAAAFLCFIYWVYRSLTLPPVMEARRLAGANARKPVLALVIGAALAVCLVSLLALMTKGASAEKAIELAKAKTGPGYKYHIASMHWSGGSGGATVTAYNRDEIKEVKVEW